MSYFSLGDNENEDDFSPPLGGMSSNLGSLFGMNAQMDNRAGSNQSLTYTAPKPPRPEKTQKEPEKKSSGSGGVAAAAAVNAYKYVGNQYKSQGKLGMALLSNYSEKDYKILMYVSKQQPVTTAKISGEFQFNIQPNNYVSFYDDQRQMWSILFSASDQLVTFAKQICLAKYHSQNQTALAIQDLVAGEDSTQPLASGDSVEAKYTGWLVQSQDGALGSIFDSNHNNDKTFRFKTGKGKVIKGWEEGMLGMKKSGKRFLVVPPSLAYGAKAIGNRVPPNSTLAFEVDVLRIKHQSSMPSSSSSESTPQITEHKGSFGSSIDAPFAGLPANEPDVPDDTVKGRTSSLNDQIAKNEAGTDSTKARLVSRMAKVGQAMLPVQAASSRQDPSPTVPPVISNPGAVAQHNPLDSQSTYSNSPGPSAQVPSPVIQPHVDYQRVVYSPQINPPVPVQMIQSAFPGNVNFQPTGVMTYNDMGRQAYAQPMQQYPQPTGDILPAILAESQSSNSKLKSLIEKVDEVAENVTKLKSGSKESDYRQSSEIMDAAQISFNIQRIVQENERVKKQILERDKLVHQQSDKITDLLRQNQKLVEESHEQIEKRNVSFNERFGQTQEKTMQLEQEKLELTNKLSAATAQVCELQLSLSNVTERANSLEKIAKVSSGQHENELKIQRLESELSSAQSLLETAKAENKKLEKTSQENSSAAVQEKSKSDETKHILEGEIKKLRSEIISIKSNHEQELATLKKKFEGHASETAHRQEQLEENWKQKCRDTAAKVSKAAEEKIEEVNEEKDALTKKLEVFQQKMLQLKGMYEEKVKSEESLKEKLEEFETTKQRYDNLRKQAMVMKQKYEETITELRENPPKETGVSDVDTTAQIKVVMNKVFQKVRAEIVAEDDYSGSEVVKIVLDVVKSTTLELLNPGDNSGDSEEDEEEDESEEEESDGNEQSDPVDSAEDSTPQQGSAQEVGDVMQDSCTKVKPSENTETSEGTIKPVEPESACAPPQETQNQSENGESGEKGDEPLDAEIGKTVGAHTSKVESKPAGLESREETADDSSPESEKHEKADKEVLEVTSEEKSPAVNSTTQGTVEAKPDSPVDDSKPSPPPLFDDDDDDDDDDLGWLS